MTQLWYPEKCPSKSAAVLHRTCELGSLLQTLSQPRKGNPNPNKGTTGREDCDLCNHWSNSSARQLWSCAIIHYRYRKRFLTKIRQTITVPEGTSIIFRHRSSLALSLSVQQHNHKHCPAGLESCDVAPDSDSSAPMLPAQTAPDK